jgi:hypothetical protein
MGVQVRWDNDDKTIACYDFSDPWTWDQFHEAVTEIHAMVGSVTHKVDYIADMSVSRIAPGNAIFHIRHAIQDAPTNSGLLVVVGGSAYAGAILKVVSRFTNYVQVATTVKDAHSIIEKRQNHRKKHQSG